MVMIEFENYCSISLQLLPYPQNEIDLMIVAGTIRFQIILVKNIFRLISNPSKSILLNLFVWATSFKKFP